jgi:phage-related protein
MALFPLPVIAEIPSTKLFPGTNFQLGDGYEQNRLNTLSTPETIWDVKVVFTTSTELQTLQAFLLSVGQHKPFQWKSPIDTVPQDYQIVGKVSGTKRNGGGAKPLFFTRTMQFKKYQKQSTILLITPISSATYSIAENVRKSFISTTYKSAAPINLIPVVTSVISTETGWRIRKAGAANTAINYSIAVNQANFPAYTNNYTLPANASVTTDIPVLPSYSGTQTLTILPGAGYIVAPSSGSVTKTIPSTPAALYYGGYNYWLLYAEIGTTVNYAIQVGVQGFPFYYQAASSRYITSYPERIYLLPIRNDGYERAGGYQYCYVGVGNYTVSTISNAYTLYVPPVPVIVYATTPTTWTISGGQYCVVTYTIRVVQGSVSNNFTYTTTLDVNGISFINALNFPSAQQRLQIQTGNPTYAIGSSNNYILYT